MHEIPPQVEQMLRAQGVSDAELDELRRTGELHRGDDGGNSINVSLSSRSVGQGGELHFDGTRIVGAELPPEALEKLRRFHRFIPKGTLEQLEAATGQDIDGDGRVGGAAAAGARTPQPPAPASSAGLGGRTTISSPTHQASGAMPTSAGASGPFVTGGPSGGPSIPWRGIVIFLVAAAVAWFIFVR